MFKEFKNFINSIDKEASLECKSKGVEAFRFKIWVILLTSAISILALHYLKFDSAFNSFLKLFGFTDFVASSKFYQLYSNLWWSSWHILLFLIVPIFIIKAVFKENLSSYGWQKGLLFKHWKIYFVAILFLIAFLSWFSYNNRDFANFYPFYRLAYRSWFDLVAWEILYIAQFVALEFFFRGFIVQGLRVPFGSLSVGVMVIPYMMIHLPKLWQEATGAIAFGIFLGFLALKSRTIWGGVLIHISVALTLDICAILQTHGLPKTLFP